MISKYRLFLLIFIPAALTLAAGMLLIQQKNRELSSRQFEAQLKSQWQLAALIAEDRDYQAELAGLYQKQGLRITLVGTDGQVLGDSAVSGPLEPHGDRQEIKQALAGRPAMAVRYSRSTGTHSIYYAEKLPDGRALRVAYPAAYYDAQSASLMDQALAGLVFSVAAVALFAFIISRRMSAMLASLSLAVKEAQDGGLDLPSFGNRDLDQALFALSSANRDLKLYSQENHNLRQRLEYILANINEGVLLLADDKILYHNRRAEEILNRRMPASLLDMRNQELMDLFSSFTAGRTGDLQFGDKTIMVSQTVSESRRLVMLHDVSDREKYSGYKSDLVGNISHELKTPLTLIMGASEVILKDADMPRTFLDKFLGAIYKNAHRINLLLDDLIFLHRLERIRESEPGPVNLGEIVDELKDLLGPVSKTVNYEFDPVAVRVHASHLVSLLTNLISNANKYSQGQSIEVQMRQSGGALEIRVADQGPPIPPAEHERIFERFYTVSKSRNRGESGSGLGLSIVKHIARIYKGRVSLEANPGGGNTFAVRLLEK
ncbi:MAG: PAS domain-containing protein [Candidatus Adiutrix sp.]|jgi:two-component system phosphate regulon sensor histidine kinase PhoR|nr:PAS domain-containing protein [Candidatus Adiutrix sp.]